MLLVDVIVTEHADALVIKQFSMVFRSITGNATILACILASKASIEAGLAIKHKKNYGHIGFLKEHYKIWRDMGKLK
jgi:hypothetical protein